MLAMWSAILRRYGCGGEFPEPYQSITQSVTDVIIADDVISVDVIDRTDEC